MCAVEALSKKKRGQANPHPPRLPATATWNGKVKNLIVPRNDTFT